MFGSWEPNELNISDSYKRNGKFQRHGARGSERAGAVRTVGGARGACRRWGVGELRGRAGARRVPLATIKIGLIVTLGE